MNYWRFFLAHGGVFGFRAFRISFSLNGGIGDFGLTNAGDRDTFGFLINEVELDLAKTFGENIRLRSDIDFTNLTNTTGAAGVRLEQAYVTANLGVGNGMEFLIGSFNAPIGNDSVDIRDNWLVSHNNTFRYLTPANTTGAKLYYAFSDLVDWHFAVVNDLNDNGFADSALPSVLNRLGFNWGEEGNKNKVGLAIGVGPENTGHNAHWDWLGDVDAMFALGDNVDLALEAAYRQTNDPTPASGISNQKAFGAVAAINYQASDVWDVTFRADWLWDLNNPALAGGASTTGTNWNGAFEGTLLGGSVGAGYAITDGAKLKMEYRFDFAAVSGPANNSDYHSLLAEFAYSF